MDKGLPSGVLFLDLKKAFDTVDHDIMAVKLRNIGMASSAIAWFSNYLSNRKQVTKVDGIKSLALSLIHI